MPLQIVSAEHLAISRDTSSFKKPMILDTYYGPRSAINGIPGSQPLICSCDSRFVGGNPHACALQLGQHRVSERSPERSATS